MIRTSPRLSRRICLLLAGVLILASALALAACRSIVDPNGGDPTPAPAGPFPNEKQKQAILDIAEAFQESGDLWDEQNVLSMTKIEAYVYWLYNDELTADDSGFASIPAEQSDKRLGAYFGVEPVLRTGKRSDVSQDYYYSGSSYYVRVKPSAVTSSELTSLTEDADGGYTAKVELRDGSGVLAELIMTLRPNDDGESVRIYSAERLDGR